MVRFLDISVVLVVGMRLGCLNHALLTAEAIRSRGLPFAGWVANRIDSAMPFFEDNLEFLKQEAARAADRCYALCARQRAGLRRDEAGICSQARHP